MTLTAVLRRAGLGVVRLRTEEHMAHHRALFQVVLNRVRKLAGRNPAPLNYDPAEVKIVSLLTWVLAQESRLHRFLAWLGWGEELVFAARKD